VRAVPMPTAGSRPIASWRKRLPYWLARRCCVVAWWAGWGAAVLGLDSGSEFGEGVRDPVPRIDVGAKFVVAAVEVLNKGVPCADHSGRTQLFEPAHRP
jgi:hypothetical protein